MHLRNNLWMFVRKRPAVDHGTLLVVNAFDVRIQKCPGWGRPDMSSDTCATEYAVCPAYKVECVLMLLIVDFPLAALGLGPDLPCKSFFWIV